MSSSTLIELREVDKSGHKKNPNLEPGDFDIVLKQPLIIEKGSSLGIKSGFIDSVDASSGKINIPENNSYSISYYLGFQNYSRDGKLYNNWRVASGVGNADGSYPDIDNKLYFACNIKGSKDPNYEHEQLIRIDFTQKGFSFHGFIGEDYPITVTYTDEYGNEISHGHTIPRVWVEKASFTSVLLGNVVARKGTARISSPSWHEISKHAHVSKSQLFTSPYAPPSNAGVEIEPKIFKLTFSLPPGDYKPSHLADLLTEACTNNTTSSNEIITVATNSAFLKTTEQIDTIIQTDDGAGGDTIYMCETGSNFIQYTTTNTTPDEIWKWTADPKVIGTDQFSFEYDSDIDKIVLAQSHSNLYSTGSGGGQYDGDPIIKIMPNSYTIIPTTAAPKPPFTTGFWATRNGVALVASMEPPTFWFGELGLNPNIQIQPSPELSTHTANANMGNFGTGVTSFGFPPIINGQHATNSFIATSLSIQKNDNFNNLINFNYLESITSANIKIYGLKSILNAGTNDGYFLISIDSFGSKFLGQYDINNNIKEVVTTFYQTENFTSFDSNSTPYIHNSDQPLVITSFKVRILTPNLDLASYRSREHDFFRIFKTNTTTIYN
jgi:hypothetical protein